MNPSAEQFVIRVVLLLYFAFEQDESKCRTRHVSTLVKDLQNSGILLHDSDHGKEGQIRHYNVEFYIPDLLLLICLLTSPGYLESFSCNSYFS